MKVSDVKLLGNTTLLVTPVCLGTSPLASMPDLYGYEVDDARAEATVEAVLRSPINFIDTSNNYGGGTAETRIGRVLARHGGLPEGVVLATKVDADAGTRDFSGERVRRSVEESFARLAVARIQLMYLHDPEFYLTFDQAMAPGGPVEALVDLRDAGVIDHLGVAAGDISLTRALVSTGAFEVVLNHNRFTLVDRSADQLIDDTLAHGAAFINAAPYGGGLLSKGPDARTTYGYREADGLVLERVRQMERACASYGVPLPAAALQFSMREPRVSSTVVGVSTAERVDQTVALTELEIPDPLWEELAALTPPSEHWLR